MGEFTIAMSGQRATPNDCITRLNDALDEIASIRQMMAAAPSGSGPADANRKRSLAHLADAWTSVGWALRAVWLSQRDRTRAEDIDASVIEYRRELADLRAEVKRLEAALSLSQADLERSLGYAAPGIDARSDDELSHRLRRLIMSALHPDKAANVAEGAWRTSLCQTLFPEIDRIIGGG